MVHEDAVARVLQPWLGAAFIGACDVCAKACAELNAFSPEDGDPEALSARLSTLLFQQVRTLTKGDMRVLLDDRRVIRIRVDDIDQMADELLYLALCRIPRNAWQYGRLRQFALSHESLAAMRALYQQFAAFQTADELQLIARTVRACHPAYRWQSWLPHENER